MIQRIHTVKLYVFYTNVEISCEVRSENTMLEYTVQQDAAVLYCKIINWSSQLGFLGETRTKSNTYA